MELVKTLVRDAAGNTWLINLTRVPSLGEQIFISTRHYTVTHVIHMPCAKQDHVAEVIVDMKY